MTQLNHNLPICSISVDANGNHMLMFSQEAIDIWPDLVELCPNGWTQHNDNGTRYLIYRYIADFYFVCDNVGGLLTQLHFTYSVDVSRYDFFSFRLLSRKKIV